MNGKKAKQEPSLSVDAEAMESDVCPSSKPRSHKTSSGSAPEMVETSTILKLGKPKKRPRESDYHSSPSATPDLEQEDDASALVIASNN